TTTSPTAGTQQPTPVELDTNSASTYNPSGYPEGRFGDPSLAIDGDPSTGWSAQVDRASPPRVGAGLAIDLRSPQRLSAAQLVTSRPGMTGQLFGTTARTLPAKITDPAWVGLSSATVLSDRHVRLPLAESTKAFRFVVLWISKAPDGSSASARVSVNEL